jgi:hypothetical protein
LSAEDLRIGQKGDESKPPTAGSGRASDRCAHKWGSSHLVVPCTKATGTMELKGVGQPNVMLVSLAGRGPRPGRCGVPGAEESSSCLPVAARLPRFISIACRTPPFHTANFCSFHNRCARPLSLYPPGWTALRRRIVVSTVLPQPGTPVLLLVHRKNHLEQF